MGTREQQDRPVPAGRLKVARKAQVVLTAMRRARNDSSDPDIRLNADLIYDREDMRIYRMK